MSRKSLSLVQNHQRHGMVLKQPATWHQNNPWTTLKKTDERQKHDRQKPNARTKSPRSRMGYHKTRLLQNMMNFSSRLFIIAPFSFSSVLSTVIVTSSTNLSLPLDDSDLECPLPSREIGLPSQCKYNEDGSGYITSCGPMDGFTGKSVKNNKYICGLDSLAFVWQRV